MRHIHNKGTGNEPFKHLIDTSRGGALKMNLEVRVHLLSANFCLHANGDYSVSLDRLQDLLQRVEDMEKAASECYRIHEEELRKALKERAQRLQNIRNQFEQSSEQHSESGSKRSSRGIFNRRSSSTNPKQQQPKGAEAKAKRRSTGFW